jgi:integrase
MARQKKLKGFLIRFGRYHIITDPVTKMQLSTGCTDPEAALMWRAERERLAQQPAIMKARLATVGEWLEKLIAHKAKRNRQATIDYHKGKCKPLTRLLGGLSLADVTPGTFDDYLITRRAETFHGKPTEDNTIARELRELIAALRLAKRADQFTGDLERLMPEGLSSSSKVRKRSPTPEEVTKLIRAMPSPVWGAYVAICYALGCRRSEAWRLRPEDFERKRIKVRNEDGTESEVVRTFVWIDGRKTDGSNRIVPVLKSFEPLVEYALPQLPIGELNNMSRAFATACKHAGIERIASKDLRRGHATEQGKRGVSNQLIAGLLGHKTVSMSQRVYNQAKAEELVAPVEAILEKAEPIVFGDLGTGEPEQTRPGRKGNAEQRNPCAEYLRFSDVPIGRREIQVRPGGFEPTTTGFEGPASDSTNNAESAFLRATSATGCNPIEPDTTSHTDVFPTLCHGRSSDADLNSEAENQGLSNSSRHRRSKRRDGDLVPLIGGGGVIVARVPVTPADILADLERPSRFAPDLAVPTVESLAAAARDCVNRRAVGL